jgi:sugar lactone lactonase YvrE
MAGEFSYVHTLALDSKGNLYTAETIGGRRVQRFRVVGRDS